MPLSSRKLGPPGPRLAVALLLALPCAGQSPAAGAPAPRLAAELEGQLVQPGGPATRGAGASVGAAVRLSEQLFATGSLSGLALGTGGATAIGFGLRALLDSTPVAPFLDFQVVELLPPGAAGYQLATRIGLGADWRLSSSVSVGLALRTLTALDPSPNSPPSVAGSAGGIEIGLRLVIALFAATD